MERIDLGKHFRAKEDTGDNRNRLRAETGGTGTARNAFENLPC